MKILYLCHRIPYPPNKGDKLRAYNFLKHLSEKHEITLLTLFDDPKDEKQTAGLEKICQVVKAVRLNRFWSTVKVFPYLFTGLPLTLPFFFSKRFKKIVDEHLNQKYDLIMLFSSSMAQYVQGVTDTPMIIDLVDADSEKWLDYAKYAPWYKAWIYRLEGKRVALYEKLTAPWFKYCLVVSEQEQALLEKHVEAGNIRVVKNGIDLTSYQKEEKPTEVKKDLLFIGGMFYFAYIDGISRFYHQVFGKIKKRFPSTRFYVVGADPAPEIQRLGRDSQVEVTGFVPDVVPYLRKAAVYVVPLRMAPGLQNKILEAMAMEVPVVATGAAAAGIEAEAGYHLEIENDLDRFADRVIELLEDPAKRKTLCARALKLLKEKHDWKTNLAELDEMLLRV